MVFDRNTLSIIIPTLIFWDPQKSWEWSFPEIGEWSFSELILEVIKTERNPKSGMVFFKI